MQNGFVENRLLAAVRCHQLVADPVDEVHRDQPRHRALLAVGADSAHVAGVPDGEHGDAELPGPDDREVGGLATDDVAEPPVPVHDEEGPVVAHDHGPAVRPGPLSLPVADVGWQHADPVAVVSPEVRLHQVVGDDSGLTVVAARRAQHRANERVEASGIHSPRPAGRCPPLSATGAPLVAERGFPVSQRA